MYFYLLFIPKLIVKLFFLPFYIIDFIIPKKENIWVFGSWSGYRYCDNSKYLYNFVSKKQNQIAIWSTRNKKIIPKLKKEGKNVFYFYSFKGLKYYFRAKFLVLSVSYDDISPFCYLFPLKSKIIQLYHGSPLKRLEIEKNRSILNRIIRFILISYLGRKYDYVITSSEIMRDKFNIFFKIKKDNYLITGYPRNDALFYKKNIKILDNIRKRFDFNKIIFYLPTYREYTKDDLKFNLFKKFNFDEKLLLDILERHKAIFLIKLHPVDYKKSSKILSKFQNKGRIIILNEEDIEGDIYPLLAKTDILITDYSSVFFDFLLLNRPIIFAAFDVEKYIKYDRGFYFDYDEITPGPKVKNWLELVNNLEDCLINPQKYQKERLKVNNLVNKYKDNRSCERVFNNLINKKIING